MLIIKAKDVHLAVVDPDTSSIVNGPMSRTLEPISALTWRTTGARDCGRAKERRQSGRGFSQLERCRCCR